MAPDQQRREITAAVLAHGGVVARTSQPWTDLKGH